MKSVRNISLRKAGAAFLLLLLLVLSSAASAEYGRIKTSGGELKVRKGPGTDKSILTTIPNKTIVELEEVGDEWCRLTWKGKTGWIMTRYVILYNEDPDSVQITLSDAAPSVGQEFRIDVSCPGADSYRYSLATNEKTKIGDPVPYSCTYYRPRKAGLYCLIVTAYASGKELAKNELSFRVTEADESAGTSETLSEDGLTIYSQKDGWWLGVKYGDSNLSDSGCAIFTLAHALQLMGKAADETAPAALASRFAWCLVDGGTLNSSLISSAGKTYGFSTKKKLIHDEAVITEDFQAGALFSFAVVKGHIALAAGLSEDGTKVRVIDSSPATTLARIKGGRLYVLSEDGQMMPVDSVTELPGIKYYFETDLFGGASYYLDLSYAAERGLRLIQP